MRMLTMGIAIIGLMVISSNANAWNYGADPIQSSWRQERHQYAPYYPHRYAVHRRRGHAHRYAYRTHGGGVHVSGDCWVAAKKGGPCGCEAMKIVGLVDRKFWLVANWLGFPRTDAHVGAAAIWGRHHVEIVTSVNGDGTVNTTGSVGFNHVRISRLAFVDPRR
jgi:hypothetical protein